MPHVHLLVTCWMAIGLLALHRYVERRRPIDLVWLAVAWLLNGLTSGYYLVYFGILVGLWMLWFLRDRGAWVAVGATLAVASAPILVLLAGYARIQRGLGFARSLDEIEAFSADLSAFLAASSHTWLPHHWSLPARAEGELYPGLTIVLLTVAGAVAAWRRLHAGPVVLLRRWFAAAGALALALSVVSVLDDGATLNLGFFQVPFTRPDWIVSTGIWLLTIAAFLVRRWWRAWERRSVLAFYGLAALAMAVLSLGPVGYAFGARVLHLAPYSWLMAFPGGDSLRVPARFAMLMMLCLSITAAIAFARFTVRGAGRWLVAAVAVLVLADGWVPNMLVARAQESVTLPGLDEDTVVIEVPNRDLYSDTAAMLRATVHGRPLVNGFSGYGPAHYLTLIEGLRAGDPSVFESLRTLAPLAVLVNRGDDPDGAHDTYVSQESGGQLVYRTPVGPVYRFTRKAPATRSPGARPVAIARARANINSAVTWALTDGTLDTQWDTAGPQEAGTELTLTFPSDTALERIEMDLGAAAMNYPRSLRVDALRADGSRSTVWHGGTAGPAVLALIADRVRAPLTIDLPKDTRATGLILTLTESEPVYYWTIAELRVFGR